MPRLKGEDRGGEYGARDVWILAIGVSREMMTINVTPIMLEYDKDYRTSVIFVRSRLIERPSMKWKTGANSGIGTTCGRSSWRRGEGRCPVSKDWQKEREDHEHLSALPGSGDALGHCRASDADSFSRQQVGADHV